MAMDEIGVQLRQMKEEVVEAVVEVAGGSVVGAAVVHRRKVQQCSRESQAMTNNKR